MNSRKPITSFEELAQHRAAESLANRKAIVVRGNDVYQVDRSDVDDLEFGGRVADELR